MQHMFIEKKNKCMPGKTEKCKVGTAGVDHKKGKPKSKVI